MRKLFAASLLFASCAAAHATSMEQRSGNIIIGRAIVRTVADDGYTCAGRFVALIPDTPSSRALVQATFANQETGVRTADGRAVLAITGPLYGAAARKARCDSQGVFRFSNVPDGTYYAVALVGWGVPSFVAVTGRGMGAPSYWTGNVLMHRVQVSGGAREAIALVG